MKPTKAQEEQLILQNSIVEELLSKIKTEQETNKKFPLTVFIGHDVGPVSKEDLEVLNEKLEEKNLKAKNNWQFADEHISWATRTYFLIIEKAKDKKLEKALRGAIASSATDQFAPEGDQTTEKLVGHLKDVISKKD